MQCQEATGEEHMEKKKTLPSLPEELIIQILVRLSVKYLIRFKCVCKSWFSLISDHHFANSHFQLSAATPTRRILFITQSSYVETESIDVETPLNSDFSSTSLYLNFMYSESGYDIQIKGSCRGFILLHGYYNIYLWNPSTGLHKKLPLSPYDGCKSNRNYFYGFGYDHSTDDYLLVSLSQETSFYDQKLANTKHLEFFSLRANTWKEIEGDFPYCNASDNPKIVGSFFNGAIHWFAFRHDLRYEVIVAFDLMERKLLEMCLPEDGDFEYKICDLWVFGEFLSLWAMDNHATEIWVMKEYKVNSSWTKILVLSNDGNGISTDYFSLICSTKSGDIIGSDDGKILAKYNDRGELIEYISYSYRPQDECQAAMYTESLLSLPGPSDNEQA